MNAVTSRSSSLLLAADGDDGDGENNEEN